MSTYIITTRETSITTYEIEADSVEQAHEYLEYWTGDCKIIDVDIADCKIIREREA